MYIEDVMRKYLDMFDSAKGSKEQVYEEVDYNDVDTFEGEILNALLKADELDDLYRRYGMDDVLAAVNYEAERSTEAEEQSVESSIKRIKHDLARSSGEVDESVEEVFESDNIFEYKGPGWKYIDNKYDPDYETPSNIWKGDFDNEWEEFQHAMRQTAWTPEQGMRRQQLAKKYASKDKDLGTQEKEFYSNLRNKKVARQEREDERNTEYDRQYRERMKSEFPQFFKKDGSPDEEAYTKAGRPSPSELRARAREEELERQRNEKERAQDPVAQQLDQLKKDIEKTKNMNLQP